MTPKEKPSAAGRAKTETRLIRLLKESGWKRLNVKQIDDVALQLRGAVESSLRRADGPGQTVDLLMVTLEHGMLGPITRGQALDILEIVAELAMDLAETED